MPDSSFSWDTWNADLVEQEDEAELGALWARYAEEGPALDGFSVPEIVQLFRAQRIQYRRMVVEAARRGAMP